MSYFLRLADCITLEVAAGRLSAADGKLRLQVNAGIAESLETSAALMEMKERGMHVSAYDAYDAEFAYDENICYRKVRRSR